MSKIQRALLSVSDKTGLVDLARTLVAAGVELLSTGGTAISLVVGVVNVFDMLVISGFRELF